MSYPYWEVSLPVIIIVTPINESTKHTFSIILSLSLSIKYPNTAVNKGTVFITNETKTKGKALIAII